MTLRSELRAAEIAGIAARLESRAAVNCDEDLAKAGILLRLLTDMIRADERAAQRAARKPAQGRLH